MRRIAIAAVAAAAFTAAAPAAACEWHAMGLSPYYAFENGYTDAYASPWTPQPSMSPEREIDASETAAEIAAAEQELQAAAKTQQAERARPSFDTSARNALLRAQAMRMAANSQTN